jgi:phospholipase/carboxylesterase
MRDPNATAETPRLMTRREALRCTTVTALALATGACGSSTEPKTEEPPPSSTVDGRLTARPTTPTRSIEPGLHHFGIGGSRDGLFYVPTGYRPTVAAPLAVLLHGAGQDATEMIDPIRPLADETGLILVAPDSRDYTWDVIYNTYSVDADFIDGALRFAFARVRVDPARVSIAGFSDGGSYSLSLGLVNGDFFSRIVAYSPGFVAAGNRHGLPKVLITHGTRDGVLPINQTSRVIVPALKEAGYDVEYHEFDGGHGVSQALLEQSVEWLSA